MCFVVTLHVLTNLSMNGLRLSGEPRSRSRLSKVPNTHVLKHTNRRDNGWTVRRGLCRLTRLHRQCEVLVLSSPHCVRCLHRTDQHATAPPGLPRVQPENSCSHTAGGQRRLHRSCYTRPDLIPPKTLSHTDTHRHTKQQHTHHQHPYYTSTMTSNPVPGQTEPRRAPPHSTVQMQHKTKYVLCVFLLFIYCS